VRKFAWILRWTQEIRAARRSVPRQVGVSDGSRRDDVSVNARIGSTHPPLASVIGLAITPRKSPSVSFH
jgi:hypothetical protein